VDPQADVPDGYTEEQRDRPGGFTADPDVMDTWATSSLTPQIAGGWVDDEDLFARVFPYDLRPQGPEIIRTWLFSTVLRSHQEHGVLPWAHATINGWILDPDRKKMSKSTGNTLEPGQFVARHGADGFRYWSCRSGLGVDTAIDEGQMRVGRRLATKVLNAGRFVLGLGVTGVGPLAEVTEPLDRSLLQGLARVAGEATAAFEAYEFQRALDVVETFFWTFCDDYVELVKDRAYEGGPGAASAKAALALAQGALLRLLAPVLPFVTEEVWSWWRPGSVHRAPWPAPAEFRQEFQPAELAPHDQDTLDDTLDAARAVLAEIRKAKSQARLSQRSRVEEVRVVGTPERLAAVRAAAADLTRAGSVAELVLEVGEPAVAVRLAPPAG
jgi:valyl-tRNA synthetase